MDFVFVLEDDPTYLRQLTDALKNIQDRFEIRSFANLAELSNMIKSIMMHGPLALAKDDRDPVRVVLVIARLELLGGERFSLLEKTRDFFIRRGICSREEPTRFVLTAFDNAELELDHLKNPILANVILKPFDKLILEQHLQMAMPQVKSGQQVLLNQKTSALVEMLKTVQVTSMSELGFESESSQALEVGSIGKYYGRDFATEKHRSVLARLISCKKMAEDRYLLGFRYFALDPIQTSNIRRAVRNREEVESKEITARFDVLPPAEELAQQCFVILDPNDAHAANLAGTIRRKIQGSDVIHFRSKKDLIDELGSAQFSTLLSAPGVEIEIDRQLNLKMTSPDSATLMKEPLQGSFSRFVNKEEGQKIGLWLMGQKSEIVVKVSWLGQNGGLKFKREGNRVRLFDLEPEESRQFLRPHRKIKHRIGAVFLADSEILGEALATWSLVDEQIRSDQGFRPPTYVMAQRELTDEEEKSLSAHVHDIFFNPLDRIYLLQKLIFDVPGIQIVEDPVVVHEKLDRQVIRAASPIKIDEISEALVVFNYHRPLDVSSFREFILWQPNETSAPEISAIVNSCQPGDDKTPSRVGMTFFGVRDEQLKAIRLWIRNIYIAQKEKS